MRALGEADYLALWERGASLHPLDRGLLALHTGFPEASIQEISNWPLGRRNIALAQLRRGGFGAALNGWTACRNCETQLEFVLDAAAIAETTPSQAETIDFKGATYRLPTTNDLAHVMGAPDTRVAASHLAARCRIDDGADAEPDLDALGDAMAQADPLAEIILHFDCPVCEASFDESLDLVTFFWREIAAPAQRLLRDIHTLASAYGWREADVLALSPARRAAYIDMVQA
jgi:hypothetical protein